jgi:cyanophycin synthetase
MNIINTKICKGPNIWSETEHHVIVLTISDDNKTNSVKDPESDLKKLIPSLFEENKTLFKNKVGDLALGELVAMVAKELQWLAGMPSKYIKSNSVADAGQSYGVFTYSIEQVGIAAGKFAVGIINGIFKGEPFSDLKTKVAELIHLRSRYSIGPTATYLLDEIKKRKIPFKRFSDSSLTLLGYGIHQKKLRTALTDSTSGLGMELASDKEETKQILSEAHIPVPKGILVTSKDELLERINEVRFPFVIKPLDGNHGRGITTDIHSVEKALFGFDLAQKISRAVIVEEFIKGDDYRFLVVNYKLIAATKRTPAFVKGDGKLTIAELIEKENENPERGRGAEFVLAPIIVDAVTSKIIKDKNLSLDSVLEKDEILVLKETANISAGGIATDVTDSVHPENVFMAERIARIFNLDICGIDIMATALDVPLTRSTGAIIEVNAGPGLRMHSNPQEGKPRNVAAKIVDMLYPVSDACLIPIIALSDFEGSTTCTLLLSHLLKQQGDKPGCSCREGIFVQGHLTAEGDRTTFEDMEEVLFDPTIDVAVLQCIDPEISDSGLPFDKCDFVVIADTKNLEHKKVLLQCLSKDGYAVLNADDAGLYSLRSGLSCKVALFGTEMENNRIKEHVLNGCMALSIKNGNITFFQGLNETPLIIMDSIAQYNVTADINIGSILPALLIAALRNNNAESIREGLRSFDLKNKVS